jgi:hypothetical protein
LTLANSNITALKWEPKQEKLLAQATLDKKITLWDIETEQVKFEVQLNSHVTHIEWNPNNSNLLYLIQANGELKSIDLHTKLVN